jgi:hypothetical protein
MNTKTQLLVLSALLIASQTLATSVSASPYPADAEASFNLPALDTYADRHARMQGSESWGVSKREQPVDPFLEALGIAANGPFPSSGGPIDGGGGD